MGGHLAQSAYEPDLKRPVAAGPAARLRPRSAQCRDASPPRVVHGSPPGNSLAAHRCARVCKTRAHVEIEQRVIWRGKPHVVPFFCGGRRLRMTDIRSSSHGQDCTAPFSYFRWHLVREERRTPSCTRWAERTWTTLYKELVWLAQFSTSSPRAGAKRLVFHRARGLVRRLPVGARRPIIHPLPSWPRSAADRERVRACPRLA